MISLDMSLDIHSRLLDTRYAAPRSRYLHYYVLVKRKQAFEVDAACSNALKTFQRRSELRLELFTGYCD